MPRTHTAPDQRASTRQPPPKNTSVKDVRQRQIADEDIAVVHAHAVGGQEGGQPHRRGHQRGVGNLHALRARGCGGGCRGWVQRGVQRMMARAGLLRAAALAPLPLRAALPAKRGGWCLCGAVPAVRLRC